MYKAYSFRIYPNEKQKILIHKTFGCYRFVYNYFLDKCKNNGYIKAYDMCKELKELNANYEWLKEVDSCSLRCAIFNLEDAYKSFFNKKSNYPKLKNKYTRQTYRTNCIKSLYKGKDYSNINIDLIKKVIKLPKLGNIKLRGYRNLDKIDGNIINATVIKETTGKYYVSVVLDIQNMNVEKVIPKSIVGIDLGLKDLVVTSSGVKYKNKKGLSTYEKRLKRLMRKLSRQIKGSNNYVKTKIKISKLHSKIKNSRKHNIINIVNDLVKEYDIIVSEKLNIKNMEKNHSLAKSIVDASMYKVCSLLSWKTKLKGKYYYQVDTYFPSSKMCSHCGEKTTKTNNLGVRKWECEKCGRFNDRDINASINIMFEGLKYYYGN